MNIEICTLCEYASDHQGRLTIVDTFDTVKASKLPWREYFYIALKVNLDKDHKPYSTMSIVVEKQDDGSELFATKGPVELGSDISKFTTVAGFKGLIFNSAGSYLFKIMLDDDVIVVHPFNVIVDNAKA